MSGRGQCEKPHKREEEQRTVKRLKGEAAEEGKSSQEAALESFGTGDRKSEERIEDRLYWRTLTRDL